MTQTLIRRTTKAVLVVLFMVIGGMRANADEPSWYSTALSGSNQPLIDLTESSTFFKGLSVSGFVNNTTGMWVNSSGIRYQKNKNSLATERNWLQLDINYGLSDNDHLFIRWWGVYEPAYPFEYNSGLTDATDFYNQYTVRDAFWSHKQGPLQLFMGRQIVTWGESLVFRVGDVVNPQDLSWNFGFANLEQSRLPLWMVHPILNLPAVGPTTANFVEGIWAPAWQPMYTQVDYPNMCTNALCGPPSNNAWAHSNWFDGQHDVAGGVSLFAPFNLVAGGRFSAYPYPHAFPEPGVPATATAFPQAVNPVAPFLTFHVPGNTWSSSMEGFRLHTLIWNSEITALYWHAHQLIGSSYVEGSPASGQTVQTRWPQLNDIGITMNRPIYLAGVLSGIPLVLRTEGVWQDNTNFNTTDVGVANGVVDKSTLNTLVALDIDGMYTPWLTRTGNLTVNMEWNNYSILGYGKHLVYDGYAERWRHNEESLVFSASTSWWWGAIVPTYSALYNPDGTTFLMFPSVAFNPPWTNKYFMFLQYIGILSNDKFSSFAGGVFKGKSILLMQFQYNFMLAQGQGRS